MKLTDEELLEWGLKEDKIRQAELSNVKSAEGLKQAQAQARQRRLAVGLTRGKAAGAVIDAQREITGRKRVTKE